MSLISSVRGRRSRVNFNAAAAGYVFAGFALVFASAIGLTPPRTSLKRPLLLTQSTSPAHSAFLRLDLCSVMLVIGRSE